MPAQTNRVVTLTGVTHAIQDQVFGCLRSWLTAGEMAATDVAESPIFEFCFQALASDQLFESATNAICDLIHETQEIDDNMAVIERIVPKVITLKAALSAAEDDSGKDERLCAHIFRGGRNLPLAHLAAHRDLFPHRGGHRTMFSVSRPRYRTNHLPLLDATCAKHWQESVDTSAVARRVQVISHRHDQSPAFPLGLFHVDWARGG